MEEDIPNARIEAPPEGQDETVVPRDSMNSMADCEKTAEDDPGMVD